MTLPGYNVVEDLCQHLGTVTYRARRLEDDRPVLIRSTHGDFPSVHTLSRLKQEYELTRAVHGEHVAVARDLIPFGNGAALIADDFGGVPLATLLRGGALPLDDTLRIGAQLARGVATLHTAQLIHNEINPNTVFVNPENKQTKIVLFDRVSRIVLDARFSLCTAGREHDLRYMSPEQTGRMNRIVDHRTDLYSLGAVLYHMLTGSPPFAADDALELVYCHMARAPVAPHHRNPRVPESVAAVVTRLLAKSAEERYQSALGLGFDLEHCQRELGASGTVGHFELARRDVPEQLRLPHKVYGRHAERGELMGAFDRASAGEPVMALVAGYSGIGKSTLVHEVHRPIVARRGFFIQGKFDQFASGNPYGGLIDGFRDLIEQLLQGSESLARWRALVSRELSESHRAVVASVIPELALVLGPQPEPPEVDPDQAQHRFSLAFQGLVRVFAQPQRPLVLFIDDVQWASRAALQLLGDLFASGEQRAFLVIAAYRDNEVDGAHPLLRALDDLRRSDRALVELELGPLDSASIRELIVDTLRSDPADAGPLAELIEAKTGGNPFFLREFLQALVDDQLLTFDTERGRWTWDLDRIRTADVAENVAALVNSRVSELPATTRRLLERAACLGSRFELRELAWVSEVAVGEAARALWPALTAALLIPLSEDHHLSNLDHHQLPDDFDVEYKFAHDRVQQAAYQLIEPERRAATHRAIGQRLLAGASPDEREERIFAIVNQLDQGPVPPVPAPVSDGEGRDGEPADGPDGRQLAELNLIAAERARAASAYPSAARYAGVAMKSLGERAWSDHRDLALAVWTLAAEAAYVDADFAGMQALTDTIEENAATLIDKIPAYEIEIQALIARNQLPRAVERAVAALRLLGVDLPHNPTKVHVLAKLARTKLSLLGKGADDLAALPPASAPEALAARRILGTMSAVAYLVDPDLFPLVVLEQITLAVKQGNTPESSFGYALYGITLCGVLGDIEGGYRFGEAALALQRRFDLKKYRGKTHMAVYHFIKPWKEPLRSTLSHLRDAHDRALECGDLEYCTHLGNVYALDGFYAGRELDVLADDVERYNRLLEQFGQERGMHIYDILRSHIRRLREWQPGPTMAPGVAAGDEEGELLQRLSDANDLNAIAHIHLNRLTHGYLFGSAGEALEHASRFRSYLEAMTGTFYIAVFYFYESLAAVTAASRSSSLRRARLLRRVASNQKKMAKFARHAPSNFLHKHQLVEAERARIAGRGDVARALYDQAIENAHDNEYLNEEALARELAGRFYLAQGQRELAAHYMGTALHTYRRWGALGKVTELETGLGDLLPLWSRDPEEVRDDRAGLDLETVSKAAQAISGEIVLERLLGRLMTFAAENAGAERGVLIVPRGGRLVIEAEGTNGEEGVAVLRSIAIRDSQNLPLTVIHYVYRTGRFVVMDDAGEDSRFIGDGYIAERQPRSVLCLPLIKQTATVGILYLENNLSTGVFTPDRIELLQLLSAQIAISIENARLYATMEQKVEERTQDLAQKASDLERALQNLRLAQDRLVQSEKMASLGQLTAGIAHEIRNPLNFVNNFADLCVELTGDLREQLELHESKPIADVQGELDQILDELQFDAEKIHEHGQRASSILKRVLAHSRQSPAETESIDLNSWLLEYVELADHSTRIRRADVQVQIDTDLDGSIESVEIVPQSLGQVVINLFNNALDAVQEKLATAGDDYAPRILVQTRRLPDCVEVTIEDNGDGISPDVRDRIFDPFFTTKPPNAGTGLGLWLSYDIVVELHRGEITVESEPGVSTAFHIRLFDRARAAGPGEQTGGVDGVLDE